MRSEGSRIAAEIIEEWKREENYKKKNKNKNIECIIDREKQCSICNCRTVCEAYDCNRKEE